MAVKSVFDMGGFKAVKFGFTLRYIEIRNHFFKYYSPLPPPPPPRAPAKTFACICVTIIYTLYGSLLTFFKIKFLKNKPPGPPSECQTVWIQVVTQNSVGLHLDSNCLQKAIGRRQNYLSGQYIVLYRDRHAYVYHKYSDTLNTFNMLCPCFRFENH